MSIVQTLDPRRTPQRFRGKSLIVILRERVVQTILLIGSAVILPVSIIATIIDITRQNWLPIPFWWIPTVIFVFSAIMRDLPLSIRTAVVLISIYIIGLALFSQQGSANLGPLVLIAFSIISNALGGLRAGLSSFIASLITIIIFGILGLSSLPAGSPEMTATFLRFVQLAIIFIVTTVASNGVVTTLLDYLESTLSSQAETAQKLEDSSRALIEQTEITNRELALREKQVSFYNQIARIISRSQTVDQLLNGVLDQVNVLYDFYHTGIFLIDPQREFAILRASTSEAGKSLIAQNHRLRVGEVGMVGFVVSRGEMRLAQNVALEPLHFKNPLLPDTRAEITIPLLRGNRVVGALDVQSTNLNAFTEDDIRLLTSFAEQLTLAIERIETIEKLRADLEQIESGYRRLTQSAWGSYLKTARKNFSFRLKNDIIETDAEPNPEAKEVLAKEDKSPKAIQIENQEGEKISSLAIPILLRGQPLGVLNLRFETQHVSRDQIELLETTVSRLALALENARLLEEIQNRAAREHLVTDITSKVRSSTAVEDILRTTAEQIGKSFSVSEVLVQLRSEEL